MATKIPLLAVPNDLRYNHGEALDGGAQFCRLETLADLKTYWDQRRADMPYACVGTSFIEPARFLGHHEWVFAPTKEALIAAVVRWDEFRIFPRWYDVMSDERSARTEFQRRRAKRRDLNMALGVWTPQDEAAYASNVHPVRDASRRGFWRLAGLPCGLTHFDWFSEHARMPNDPELPKDRVELLLKRLTFDDWRLHRPLNDVAVMDAEGVDADITYWERERAEGNDTYED